jgi:ketosteroid isomerase-like protein/tetratricopeptide (TPR) repeat protein
MTKSTFAIATLALLSLAALTNSPRADEKASKPADKARPRPVSVQEAQSYSRQQDWVKAAAAYEQIVQANPHNGQHWHNYAFALHSLKRYDEAIKAWTTSIEAGFQPATGIYNLACAHSLSGHKDEALALLQKAVDAGFFQEDLIRTDTDLNPIRDDPRFKKILGSPPEGLSREERWRYDLDHLVRRMEKVHYNLYAKVSREKFREAIDDLKSRINALKDEEIVVGIQRILALVGDGHTVMMWRSRDDKPTLRYPLELYLYKEGLFVRAASAEHGDIVGSRVVRIGSASADEALAAVEPLCSRDNAMGVKLESPALLRHPAALSYLKIAEDMAHVSLVVKKPDGQEVTVELKPALINRTAEKKFVKANMNAKTPEPISFKKNDDPFWFEYLPERKLVYFQFNAVANKPGESLEKFCGRLFAFINEKPVEHLIIDMRNNSGGNNYLNRALVHGLIRCDKVNRAGHLFVVVGRRTFSAAMNGSVDIERNTNAIFVGEPTGSSPNFVGETTVLTLPCSNVRFSCSSLYWQSSVATDRRTWIAPELVAEPSIEAFAANRDPGLEAIFGYLDAYRETTQSSATIAPAANNSLPKTADNANVDSLRHIVDECNRQSIEAFKKGDMLAVARGYTDDATIYFPPGKKVAGRQAIDQMWKSIKGAKDWKLETVEVGGTKDAIYEIGKSSLTTVIDGKDNTYTCDYVVIWKRQKDGTYRAQTDIYN